MTSINLTPDEIVETLKRSSLSTVITEGISDYHAFRKIEFGLKNFSVSMLPAGGKPAVLEVYRRRSEFAHIRVAFIVDRDMWLFEGVPSELSEPHVVITNGYSIENDLYRDGELENLLAPEETGPFLRDCEAACRWFSFAVREHLANNPRQLDIHPDQLLSNGGLNPITMAACGYNGPCDTLFPSIFSDYAKCLRGKTLLHLLVKHLSYPGRYARHSDRSLLEVAAARPGTNLDAIQASIQAIFC